MKIDPPSRLIMRRSHVPPHPAPNSARNICGSLSAL
jgi:hypothetical protein